MGASVAIQILPKESTDAEVCRIVDEVIAYLQQTGFSYDVGPFETTIEGEDLDALMAVASRCIHLASEAGAPGVYAYMKVAYQKGHLLSIEEKTGKYRKKPQEEGEEDAHCIDRCRQ